MDFYDVIAKRCSVRGYQSTSVPEDVLQRLWEAVRAAPSACNFQPVRFLVLASESGRRIACTCYTQSWLAEAPLVVVALGNRETAWKRFDGTSAHSIDVSIALEHLVLAAAAEGLGTCWVCAFDQARLARGLGLAPEWEAVALTPLGYPAAMPAPKPRKPVDELIEVR